MIDDGTALHSYFNLGKVFPGEAKKQVVRDIPQEIADRLTAVGGTSRHAEMISGYDCDSVCMAVEEMGVYDGKNDVLPNSSDALLAFGPLTSRL